VNGWCAALGAPESSDINMRHMSSANNTSEPTYSHRSGASATGCRHEIELNDRYLDLRQNPVLGESQTHVKKKRFFF
jgi:hypothetical protein